MSRKWERMVYKNTKQLNKMRSKQGKKPIVTGAQDGMVRLQGRSWFLPLLLVMFSVFFLLFFYDIYEGDAMYWMTGALYFLFGLFLYFVRRPFLKIGRNRLSTRKFTGEKFVDAGDVEEIIIVPGTIIVQLKNKKERWIFSRLVQRFNLEEMETQLREFAQRHRIPVKNTLN